MALKTLGDPAARPPGRPRDEAARQKILDAALELLQREGFAKTTCESIASEAGVGKATVYRWWPNKAAVMVEAFRQVVAPEVPFPDTGSLEGDIRQQIQNFSRMLTGPRGRMLGAIVAAGQSDPVVAAAFADYWIRPRRAEAKSAMQRQPGWTQTVGGTDPELMIDLMYAPLYYRLLLGLPLSPHYADQLAALVLRAFKPG